jgi:diguanylate cyclase (GGDEF)-like protein
MAQMARWDAVSSNIVTDERAIALEALRKKLALASNFPSPSVLAQQIIDIAGDPDINIVTVAAVLGKDPALAVKILRTANSPLYAQRRKVENLRQALVVLGVRATMTLALSFSLVGQYRAVKSPQIDYPNYWRRAFLRAAAARAFALLAKHPEPEDVFLAALVQDIAILAIDKVRPDFYEGLATSATPQERSTHEVSRLGVSHVAISASLLRAWGLPESLCDTVQWSDQLAGTPGGAEALGARCVVVGSDCAQFLFEFRASLLGSEFSAKTQALLGISAAALGGCLQGLLELLPEMEQNFDSTLLDPNERATLLEQAQELSLANQLETDRQVNELTSLSTGFTARLAALEEQGQRDPLTGVFNRGHFDRTLAVELERAIAEGTPLSLIFADLDHFKQVNDTYGHPAGDAVLVTTANLLVGSVRATDCVARYGGEEFVIIIPGLDSTGAERIADRILLRMRTTRHEVNGGSIRQTASLGLATHHAGAPFTSVSRLLEAADHSGYVAKKSGRDRLVIYAANAA